MLNYYLIGDKNSNMRNKKKLKILKIALTVAIIVILGIFIWNMAPFIMKLSTVEGQEAFKEKIDSMGVGGVLLLFGLQILQILLVVLPGEPFEVLAGMCYGAWGRLLIYNFIGFYNNNNDFFYS